MSYRDGLAYVSGETGAQALCHALAPHEWRELLDGDVVRTVEIRGVDADCVVVSGPLTITITMANSATIGRPFTGEPENVGGYSVWVEDERAAAELVPGSPEWPANPFLYAWASGEVPEDGLLRELVTTLVTRLAQAGATTPVEDASGHVPFAPTAPVPGTRLFDLPAPVQGLVLCTAMVNTLPPQGVQVNIVGQCIADGDGPHAMVTRDRGNGGPAQFTIGGRPARFAPAGPLLVDLAEAPGGEYVQLMLDWRVVDQPTVRAWADRFVAQLGDL